MHPPDNLAATPPQYISWKYKIPHTSQPSPKYRKMIDFAKPSPPNIQNWSILLNHPSQHSFAPLSIKRDFGYFVSNLILQT